MALSDSLILNEGFGDESSCRNAWHIKPSMITRKLLPYGRLFLAPAEGCSNKGHFGPA